MCLYMCLSIARLLELAGPPLQLPRLRCFVSLSCAIYTHTTARTSSTNFQLYYFVIHFFSTNRLGHGHGYKWHSSIMSD